MEAFLVALASVWADSGFSALTGGHVIMIIVGLVLLYMAIGKGFEPLLLSPIAFGCILANIPKNGFEQPGVMSVIAYGIHHEVFPPLIFLGVGAMTDFGPLLANPKTLLLGAAAQGGVFVALLGAKLLGITPVSEYKGEKLAILLDCKKHDAVSAEYTVLLSNAYADFADTQIFTAPFTANSGTLSIPYF